jgi:DNA-directed RNA polymerase subunit D
MKIKPLQKEKLLLTFVVEGITEAKANTLRRLMLTEVPTLAIEEVSIQKNSSAMYDEMLAHRLGLVPLTTDLKSYKTKEECKCEGKGCAQCTLSVSIKVKGPGVVYSSAIESADPKVKAAHENIPITKLSKNQEVKVEATAILGKGKMHMKFSPGHVFYRGYPIITIEKKGGVKKCIESCDNNLTEKGDQLIIKDLTKWNEACEEICEKNGMKVEASKEDFLFTIESWGQLQPKEILIKALDIYEDKLSEFAKQVKAL